MREIGTLRAEFVEIQKAQLAALRYSEIVWESYVESCPDEEEEKKADDDFSVVYTFLEAALNAKRAEIVALKGEK